MPVPPIPHFALNEKPVSSQKLNQYETALQFMQNPPTCYCNLAADTAWGNAAFSVVTLTEIVDTDSMHDPTVNPSRITFKTAGRYEINAGATFAANATGNRVVNIGSVGGTLVSQVTTSQGTFGQGAQVYYSGVFAVNDWVTLNAYQSSGGSLNLLGTSLYTFMQARWAGIS